MVTRMCPIKVTTVIDSQFNDRRKRIWKVTFPRGICVESVFIHILNNFTLPEAINFGVFLEAIKAVSVLLL